MRTHHFVWHPGFEEYIKVSRSEYYRLKSKPRSKLIVYAKYVEDVRHHPDMTMKFLSVQLQESASDTNTAAFTATSDAPGCSGLPSHQPISPT